MKFLYPILTLLILPLIALTWLLSKIIVPFRRASKNGMIFLDEDDRRVLFSPFFEFESRFEDTALLVKTVVTLSNEALKKDTPAPLTEAARQTSNRRHIFRETALFLINEGEGPVEVTPKFIEIDGEMIIPLDDMPVVIPAGQYHECEHSMAKDAEDKRYFDLKVILEYQGAMHEISGRAERLSVERMKEKYYQGTDLLGEAHHAAK